MDTNKARKIANLVDRMDKCECFLKSLDGRSYSDEFTIHYRGIETCELEEEALAILIAHYNNKLKVLKDELAKIQ